MNVTVPGHAGRGLVTVLAATLLQRGRRSFPARQVALAGALLTELIEEAEGGLTLWHCVAGEANSAEVELRETAFLRHLGGSGQGVLIASEEWPQLAPAFRTCSELGGSWAWISSRVARLRVAQHPPFLPRTTLSHATKVCCRSQAGVTCK